MSVSRRLGAVLRLSFVVVLLIALAATVAVATGQAGNMRLLVARAGHTATAQLDGSLVIAGGTGNRGVIRSLEFFDPVSGKSTPGPRLFEARSGHSAIALADGRVLLTGGRSGDNALLASSEIYDAAEGTLNPGASMGHARANHTSTLLADGRVLIAGGDADGMAEIYDPATDRFVNAGRLAVARSGHSAVRLGDGRVLLVGGHDAAGATAEIFDPKTNTFSAVRGGLKTARVQPALKLISDGKVQVYGGDAEITMEVYNPAGYFSSRGHLLRDSSAFRSIMYSPGQAALIAIPSAKGKHYAEDALGAEASEFERTGHTATEVAAHSTMVVVGGFGATGAALDTITELGSCGGTVTTDLTDYYPGQTVVMSGSGWTPGEQITLNLHRDTNDPPDTTLYATADENGDWINAEYVVQEFDLNVTFILTATGDSGCVAQTTFTDANPDILQVRASAGVTTKLSYVLNPSGGNCLTGSGTTTTIALTSSVGLDDANFAGSVKYRLTVPATLSSPDSPVGFVFDHWVTPSGTDTSNPLCVNGSGGGNTDTYTAVYSAPTTTTLTSTPNPSTFGSNVTFTATVNAGASLVTTGSVTFIEGGTCALPGTTLAGPTALNLSGQAAFSTSTLSVASHTITACYGGASGFAKSSGNVTQVVNTSAATTTALVSSPNPSTFGSSVTFTATVNAGASLVTTGSVTFIEGGTCALPATTLAGPTALNPSGQAAFSTATLTALASPHTIVACYGGTASFSASSGSMVQTVNQATSTTTVTCPASVLFSGSALTPCSASYTTSDGLTGSLTVNYTNNTNVGMASASAAYTGDANHAASNDSKNFAIALATSTTTITCPAHVTFTGSALTSCTASYSTSDGLSGSLTVNYTNNTNAGTANASASYAGDANHASSNDSKTFIIDQASSTTTLTCPANVTYTGSPLTPCSATVTGVGGLNQPVTVNYTNNTNAGTANASAPFAGDTNHTASSDAKTFTIDPAPSTTTMTCPAHVTFTGSALTPCSATVTGVGGLSQSLTVNYTNNTNAGTANASASFAGDANHTASNDAKTFTIDQASSTTTVTCPANVTYTGSALTPCTAMVTGAGGLSQSLTVNYTSNTNAGTANASASYPGDTNHTASSDAKNFIIDPAPSVTTVFCPTNVTYTGSPLTPCTAVVTGVGGLNQALTVNYTNNVNAGTAGANASYPGDANHTGSNDSTTFMIDPAPSMTTVTCPTNVTYTGLPQTPCSAAVTGVGGLSQSLTVGYTNNIDAGTANASASYPGDPNHTGSNDAKTFTIDPAPSTTTVTCPAHVTFTGSALTPCSANVTGAGGLNQMLTVLYSNNTNAGTAGASASYAGDPNHTGSSDSKSFIIDPAPSTTTVTCPAHVTFTGSALTPCSANVTGAGGLNQMLTVLYSNNTNAGTAGASASYAGDPNHTSSSDSKSFIIDPAPSTTTVTCPAHMTFTGLPLTPCSANVTGAAGLNQSLTVVYSNNTNAGTAGASASYPGDPNHAASSDSKTFIIDPASSTTTVTCPSTHLVYTGLPQTPCTAMVTGIGGLSQSLMVSYTNNINAGTAGASALFGGDANHLPSSGSSSFVIDKVQLTVKADNINKLFGDPLTLTYKIMGFVNGETVVTAPVNGAPNCTTTATQWSVVSPPTYPITCTIGTLSAANYTFTFAGGTLTITARSALVNYIGQQTFVTSGSSSTTAQVTLSASVQDPTGLGLSGAKIDFVDTDSGKVMAGGVTVSPVANSPFTGTANAIVTLSTGQYGAQSYVILVRMTLNSNYDNSLQPPPDKTSTVVVLQPATTNKTMGGGTYASISNAAGTYAGIAGHSPTFCVGLSYNKSGTNPKGQITLTVPQADGTLYIKSTSISSMAVNGGNATIYTKSSIYEVLGNGSTVTIDGNVSLRLDVIDGGGTGDQVGFTVLSSKDSSLYYSNNWTVVTPPPPPPPAPPAQSVWKTVPEDVAIGGVMVD